MKNDTQNTHAKASVLVQTLPQTKAVDTNLVSLLGAAALGLALLFATGFAQASVMHDTAHDQRHAMAFPCH